MVKGDLLWLGQQKVQVETVDPIRGLVLVSLPDGEVLSVPPEELTNLEPCKEDKERKTRKRKKTVETIAPTPVPVTDEQAPAPIAQEPTPAVEQALELTTDPQLDFDFFVFVCSNGSVFKVGSLCLVDSCCSPFLITRLFKSSVHGSVFVTAVRCQCEGGKIVSVLHKFQVTVDGSFVSCNSTEFSLSSVSSEVSHVVCSGYSRVSLCQQRNFGNVHYLRDLRRHALGAQMRQAVFSGISLHATRPAQPVCLGALDPFHDMAIFGLTEKNKFKIPFSLLGGYSHLDGLMEKGWDVKPLRINVSDCHFKYVTSLNVYLDKKNCSLKVSFSHSEAPFPLSSDHRDKCKAFFS